MGMPLDPQMLAALMRAIQARQSNTMFNPLDIQGQLAGLGMLGGMGGMSGGMGPGIGAGMSNAASGAAPGIGALGKAMPWIGMAGGLLEGIGGAIEANKQRKEQAKQRRMFEDSALGRKGAEQSQLFQTLAALLMRNTMRGGL